MEYRPLGATGLRVSAISVGAEHLVGLPDATVAGVIRKAVESGINYFDVVYSFPDYLDGLGAALDGYRDGLLLTGHLGSTVKDGQYCKDRRPRISEHFFRDVLSRLKTDHVDVLYLHNFNTVKDWDSVARPGGLLELAVRLRDEGRARCIGISAHYPEVVERAVESGHVDVVMFPVNLLGHAMPGRRRLLDLCARKGLGLVAMKPLGGGRLLKLKGMQRVAGYQSGGESYKVRFPAEITATQCLSYTLAQRGVSTALIGVRSEAELEAALESLQATDERRDFSGLLVEFGRYVEGECVYCNHCLPCPAGIDIAAVLRLLDDAGPRASPSHQAAYGQLPVRASACTQCAACEARCPFKVHAVVRILEAARLFEGQSA